MSERRRYAEDWDEWARGRGYGSLREYLVQMYWKRSLTEKEVGELMGITQQQVSALLLRLGVQRRGRGWRP